MSQDIPDEIRLKYFDIIYEFGLLTNSGRSPAESPGMPLRIPLEIRDQQGSLRCCTAYGKDVYEVCAIALEFLEKYGWKGHSEKMAEGLMAAARAICNTITDSMRSGRMEIRFPKP